VISSSSLSKGEIILLKQSLVAALLLSGAINATDAALAANPYPTAYDATYDNKTGPTEMKMHMISNGKGQLRTETDMPGGMKSISIMDYPKKTCWTIMEKQKMIMKTKLTADAATTMDTEQAKKLKATDLGNKMVNGRMSHGWSYKTPQGTTESWTDEKAEVMTKSVTKTASMTSEMNLKSLSLKVPDDSNFAVPTTGYKVISQ
jgi:hypothetical protein